jgi:hypothetical protein
MGDPMPSLLDDAVKQIRKRGVKASSAWPMAVSSLQKSGSLKPGSLKATPKGIARGKMTQAKRRATPP